MWWIVLIVVAVILLVGIIIVGGRRARERQLENKRQEARAKCYERVKSALNGRTALRFLQVEHQLQLLIDLQIASALPISSR